MRRFWWYVLLCLLVGVGPVAARQGKLIDLAWDFTATLPTGAVAQSFQIQRCPVADCTQTCTPTDLVGATIPAGGTLTWGTAVASGTLASDTTQKTISFTAVSAQYVRIVATSEINGNPWTSAAEFTFWVNGVQIPQSSLSVVSTDSQEVTGEDGHAVNAIDGNTATFWHTEWFLSSPPHPHEIVINLGSVVALSQVRYLPRQDGDQNGTIAGYAIYTQLSLGGLVYEDAAVTGGTYYLYQIVTVGQVNGQAARSAASNQVCIYDRAQVRGRPDPFGFPPP